MIIYPKALKINTSVIILSKRGKFKLSKEKTQIQIFHVICNFIGLMIEYSGIVNFKPRVFGN